MTHMEKAKALRADTAVHYNCAQSVIIPFAAEMGITEEQAYKMGAHFGSGMRHGSTCGAITGVITYYFIYSVEYIFNSVFSVNNV